MSESCESRRSSTQPVEAPQRRVCTAAFSGRVSLIAGLGGILYGFDMGVIAG